MACTTMIKYNILLVISLNFLDTQAEPNLHFSTSPLPVYTERQNIVVDEAIKGKQARATIDLHEAPAPLYLLKGREGTNNHNDEEEDGEEWNKGSLNIEPGTHENMDARVNNETKLIAHLFRYYDNVARPVLDMSRTVEVEFGYRLLSIQMNEVDQVLTSFVWLPHRWRDERLGWQPKRFGNITKMVIPNKMLWLPDTFLYQSADDSGYVKSFDRVPIDNTGLMEWWPSATLLSPCIIDVTYFPFDYQTCSMTIGPWGYYSEQVNYTLMDVQANLDMYTVSGAWQLLNTSIKRNIQFYPDLDMSYTLIDITIKLRRKALYYWLNIIIPCLLLNSLGIGLFMLPADSGEKVSFGLGILLTVFVFAILVNENIPKTSDYTPIIGIYLVLIMVMISLSLFLAIIIENLHHRRPKLNAPPEWIKRLFLDKIPKFLGMQLPQLPLFAGFTMRGNTPKRKKKMRMMRRLRAKFLDQKKLHEDQTTTPLPTTDETETDNVERDLEKEETSEQERLEQAYKNMPFDEKYNDEWILVALVMDRVMFWGFLVLLIISSGMVLIVVPLAQAPP